MTPNTPHTPDAVRQDAQRQERRLVDIDLSGCPDKAAVMQRFAEALSLPDEFGRNWDALTDVLRELEPDLDSDGIVLMVHGAEALRQASPDDHGVLREILEEWQAERPDDAAAAYFFDESAL